MGARQALAAGVALVASIAAAPTAGAADRMRLSFATLDGAGVAARDVTLTLHAAGGRLTLTARSATLPGLGPVRHVTVSCPRLEARDGRYRCTGADVHGTFATLGPQRLRADLRLDTARGALALSLRDVRLAGAAARVDADGDERGWHATIDAPDADLGAALALAARVRPLPAGWTLAGRGDLRGWASGRGTALANARFELAVRGVAAANASGSAATDALGARLSGTLARGDRAGGGWRVDASLEVAAGQGYLDPVFVDFGKLPLTATVAATLGSGGDVAVERFSVRQRDALAASGSARLSAAPGPWLRAAELEIESLTFPGAGAYVAPFLATTPVRNATARGTLSGRVVLAGAAPVAVDLGTERLDIDDPSGALAFSGLAGRLRWHADPTRVALPAGAAGPDAADDAGDAAADVTTVGWASGRLYGVALGASRLRLTAAGRGFRLLEPAFVPILDGGLRIDRLRMRHVGEPGMWLRLDARVEPISLALVSRALGWPEFGGTVSGTIPTASLERGVLTFGGNLEAAVFGGQVTVGDLRLEDPLGRFPRLFASATVDGIDLGEATGAFSFGEITGRLSGRIEGLELFDWQPVRFDARFTTPDGDRSPHRISQRAVQNLSNLGGGGVGAALQGGVLRFFRTFGYDRLGLACRLERDVCAMSGLGPTRDGGFWIVRGRGLPRIDIVGSGDRVAWSRLVAQLAAATRSGSVEVR
jgi:hypothetical protein